MLNIDMGGVGAKDGVEGWKIADIRKGAHYIYNLNVGRPFPFKSGEVDNFYCSHTLEHVKPHLVQFVMNEFHRCLKKDGLIRIVVPDVAVAIKWYLTYPKALWTKGLPSKPDFYPDTKMGRLMSWVCTYDSNKKTDGHNMGFDWELLKHYIHKAGFREINQSAYKKYSKVFKGKDKERYQNFSIYAEAQK